MDRLPPSENPKNAARCEPTASITARRSSIRTSRVGSWSSATRSESPVPRLSKMIRRENDASRFRNFARSGVLPCQFDMRHPPGDVDQVERTFADDLVGDVHLAAARVSGLGSHPGMLYRQSPRSGRVSKNSLVGPRPRARERKGRSAERTAGQRWVEATPSESAFNASCCEDVRLNREPRDVREVLLRRPLPIRPGRSGGVLPR